MSLEHVVSQTAQLGSRCKQTLDAAYSALYSASPFMTKCATTAIGVIGGDYITKKHSQGAEYTERDLLFTAPASVAYAYLTPKLMNLADKIAKHPAVRKFCEKKKITEEWAKTYALVGLFTPVNAAYWNVLTWKNNIPITMDSNMQGAKALAIGNLVYLGVDYLVMNKIDRKYSLPIYSAVGIAYHTCLALANHMLK